MDVEKNIRLDYGIKRENPVGKRVGNNVWFHVSYVKDFGIKQSSFDALLSQLPQGFNPNIVRIDLKDDTIALINSPDFDESDEPLVGSSALFKNGLLDKITPPSNNPLIYHHKWTMVKDDYTGFDVEDAKARSYIWKSVLGVDKVLSSKIGRSKFWQTWLQENNEKIAVKNKELIMKDLEQGQEYTSKNTSLNQLAAIFKKVEKSFGGWKKNSVNLDLGGGKYDKAKEYLASFGVENLVLDKFNRDEVYNLMVEQRLKEKPADTVTISNVLNVIKEPEIRKEVLNQAKDFLNKENGLVYITVYEKNKDGKGHKVKDDQWQNNMALKDYQKEVERVFPNVGMKNGVIVASMNPKLSLFPKRASVSLKH